MPPHDGAVRPPPETDRAISDSGLECVVDPTMYQCVKGHWFLPTGGHETWFWHKFREVMALFCQQHAFA